VTLPRDMVDRIMRMAERDPAAAQAAAEKAGVSWKSILAGTVGTALGYTGGAAGINAVRPGTIPDWINPAAYVSQGAEQVLAPKPLSKELQDRYPDLTEPSSSEKAPAASTAKVPAADTSDTNISDAEREARIQELINRKVDESTAALNRMIYLSRL
jgi:hypothetical protein